MSQPSGQRPITIDGPKMIYVAIALILGWVLWSEGELGMFLGFDNYPEDSGSVSMTMAEAAYYALEPEQYRAIYDETPDARVHIQMEDVLEDICEEEGKRADIETMTCKDSLW